MVCLRSWYYFRQLAPALEILARAGHDLHIVAMKYGREQFEQGLIEFEARHPNVRHEIGPPRDDGWKDVGEALNSLLDYVQYLGVNGRESRRLRERVERSSKGRLLAALGPDGWVRGRAGPAVVRWSLNRLERAIPLDPRIEALFDRIRPDVMLLTPLVGEPARQRDYMKSAKARDVITVLAVHSWDNLSSKGRVLDRPDSVLVWNETQSREAVRYHGLARDRITVTGAQGFDEWFEARPHQDRNTFCAAAGLNPEKPVILYVCSVIRDWHVSTDCADRTEVAFVKAWLSHLRSFPDPILKDCGVIIRPHPKLFELWEHVSFEDDQVVVWPRLGELPADAASKTLFFDSLHHCGAVVGLNTTAMIEAGIIGRPVFTTLDPAYRAAQAELIHFRYLLEIGGGLIHAESDIQKHLSMLAGSLRNPGPYREKARRFTDTFVRPLGRDQPGAPIFAQAVLDASRARGASRERRIPIVDRVLRRALKHWAPGSRPQPPGRMDDKSS